MKSITIELPDEAASMFEALSSEQKTKAALLATLLAQAKPRSLAEIFESVDKRVAASGLSEKEIDEMLDELS